MERLAADLLPVARYSIIVMFALLSALAVLRARRSGASGWWAAAAFGSLALALVGAWGLEDAGVELPEPVDAIWLVLLLAFPYLLLRFTASFRRLPRWLEAVVALLAVGMLVATLARSFVPHPETSTALWATAYIPLALAYWVLISVLTAARLWHAGRRQPTVARRRVRLMSAATAVLTVALLLEVQLEGVPPSVQLLVLVVALASAMIFGLGFSPPPSLRLSWRRTEEEYLQRGTTAVLRATTVEEVASELLPPTASIVGASGVALVDAVGVVVASHGAAPRPGAALARPAASADEQAREVVPLGDGRGELVVWTGPYAPFFAREEVELLRTMATIASLALERCELLEEERARRAAVEQAQEDAERAREEATRANLAKSEFLSRMSHELRTPLNAILGFGQLLELTRLDEESAEAVDHILKAGRHLLALINDVLDLSRIEAGMLMISLEPVDAAELVRDGASLIEPLATSRSIRLTVDVSACDLYVRTDRQRCRQVLLNLLSNAVKYNRDGGEVDVRCSRVNDQTLRISVRDTGPGIDPSRHDRLFEPFERLGAENSTIEGTGLGLALSKQLMERLGGSLDVDTAPGQGSTFWIDLPVTDGPTDTDEPAASPATAKQTGERTLLLVEDNLANLRVVEAMLRRRPGVSVLPAMQGRLAIELAQEHRPDVIVLDLHLPDLSGREVLNRLRAHPATRDTPVVIASADATPGRIRQLREEGAFEYITKPLDLRRFLEVIDLALEQREASRETVGDRRD